MNEALVELANCCICCLRGFDSEEVAVDVDETLRNNFYEITGMELAYGQDVYSNMACEYCNKRINEFILFRNELIECQKSLTEGNNGFVEILMEDDENKQEVFELIQNCESEKIECLIETSDNESSKNEVVQFYEKSAPAVTSYSKNHQRKECFICGLSFTLSGYYHHLKRVHSVGRSFFCDFCGKSCKIKNDLINHMKKHLSKDSREKFACSICQSIVLSKSALNNHLKTFHTDIIEVHPCDYPNCDKSFQTRTKLLQHTKTVHETGTFPCDSCEKVFTTKQYLQKHIKQCHSVKILENCEICGKEYPKGIQLKRHMQIHEEKQRCTHPNCNKVFQFKTSLLNHIETQHLRAKPVTCDQCALHFPTIRHLNRHISRQHNNIKVKCEVEGCTHMFRRKDYLASHYKTHKEIDEITKQALIDKVKHIKDIPW